MSTPHDTNQHRRCPARELLICHINPWSVCNKSATINDFITEHDIDLLAISETWLTGTASDEPTIASLLPDGYAIIHSPRGTRGGGTALVHRESLAVARVNVQQPISFEVLECTVKTRIMVRICVVYQPQRTAQFLDEFTSYIANIVNAPGNLLVMGDFNLHVDDNADRSAREFLSSMTSLGLKQHVTAPTHRSGHTLDLVLSPPDSPLDIRCDSRDCCLSDHFAVFVRTSIVKPPLPRKTITYRKTKSITREALQDAVLSTPLAGTLPVALDEQIRTYHRSLEDVMDSLAPIKTTEIVVRHDAKWFSDGIRQAKQDRRQAERLWRSTGLTVHREMYIAERAKVNALVNTAKERHYQDQVAACGGDQQQLYRVLSELLGRAGSSPLPTGDASDLAQRFSDFFVSKITTIQNSIPATQPSATAALSYTSALAEFTPVIVDQLVRLITSSPSKHCGLDPIPTRLLKLGIHVVSPAICSIVNTSLAAGVVPDAFKEALVYPRLKKPSLNTEELGNYRPVSNLSFLSKTLERVVASQLNDHLMRNELLEPFQSAYRRHHSTETALLRIHTDIRCAIADGKVVLMALLDLSAAFDTINHDLLLQTLASIGVQDIAHQWFASYLHDRSQTVTVRGAHSEPQHLSVGVPQGSVLGPLLFTLYTRSLGPLLRSFGVSYHVYADDTQVYLPTAPDDLSNAIKRLEDCLDAVQQWMAAHCLKLNAGKTEFMVFASRENAKRVSACTLRVGASVIEQSDCVKNIGVWMDRSLSGEQHATQVCRIAYAQLKSLSKIKCFFNDEALETIVHALITSRVDYCNSILYGLNESVLQKIQVLQNSCARLLSNASRFDHITPILIRLHWLPVKQRIVFKILVITFKCIHGLSPSYLTEFLNRFVSSRSLMRSNDALYLTVPFTRSHALFTSSFRIVAPRLWNQLPFIVRSAQSLSVFKSRLKTHLFTTAFT